MTLHLVSFLMKVGYNSPAKISLVKTLCQNPSLSKPFLTHRHKLRMLATKSDMT